MIPQKFHAVHHEEINRLLYAWSRCEIGPFVQIVPLDPLFTSINEPISETVLVAMLECKRGNAGLIYAEPADEASRKIIEDWEAKYADWTVGDFTMDFRFV